MIPRCRPAFERYLLLPRRPGGRPNHAPGTLSGSMIPHRRPVVEFSPLLPPRDPTRQLQELYIRTPAQLEKSFKCEDTIDDLRHLFRGRLMAAMKHELKLYHAKVVPSRTSAPTSLPPPLSSPPALSPCRWRSSARQLRWLRRSRRRVRSRAASSSYGASCPSCRTSTSSRRPFASASQSAFASREAWDVGR